MGVLLVAWLGYQLTSMYTAFFHFPTLIYRVQLWIPLAATGISLVAAFGGALNTMRNTMQLAPAEAMHPPSPTQFHRMLLERLGLEKFLSPQLRMIIRTLERRPGNTELRRPLDANQYPIAIPPNGVLLTDRLAQKLGIHPGDHLQVEVLEASA
jgi:putative ABC transport system permease protein